MNNTSYCWNFENALNNEITLNLSQENKEISKLSLLINLLTGIEHDDKNKIENPLLTFQSSWENLILNINTIIKNGLSHKTQLIAYLWRKILYNVYINFYENDKYREALEESILVIFDQLLKDLNYQLPHSKNLEIQQNVLYSNSLLNYYDSESEEDNEEDINENNKNGDEIQKFQIKRRIKHIFNLLHMLLKDYRKKLVKAADDYPVHIGDYIWIIFEEENFSISTSNISGELIFSKQNYLEWTYEILIIQIDLIKLYNIRNINEKDKFSLICSMPIFVINHIQEYQYVFTEDCQGNLTMIVRRMLQLFNLLINILNKSIDFDDKSNTTTGNNEVISTISIQNLMIQTSRFKVKSYPEIKKLITSYESFNKDYLKIFPQQYHSILSKFIYQKLSLFLMIMEVSIYFINHSQIKNYIAHHLYDNANTSYTTFIHQPSCNAMLCQHQNYLDRECACKFLLVINRWFLSMVKMEKAFIQNNIVDKLLQEITKDIDTSDIFSYNNLPEVIVNLYSHNDSELMDTLILLQNNYIYYQYKSYKTFYNRCPAIATILEFSSPIKLFEALMNNVSYDKEILLDWIISNETTFLEYLLRYLDYTELYCTFSSKNENHQDFSMSNTNKNENVNVNTDTPTDTDIDTNTNKMDLEFSNEKLNYTYYKDNNLKLNKKKRRIVSSDNYEIDNSEKESKEITIQDLSSQLKYTSIDKEFPSMATIKLLYELRNTIDKLSKHHLIPFSPGPLLRKMDHYYQKFSFLL